MLEIGEESQGMESEGAIPWALIGESPCAGMERREGRTCSFAGRREEHGVGTVKRLQRRSDGIGVVQAGIRLHGN